MRKMTMKIWTVTVLLSMATACSQDEPADAPVASLGLTRAEETVALSYSDFAMDLLEATIDNYGDDNILISPMSATFGLSMLANGASGDVLEDILTTLRLGDSADMETINSYNKKLSRQLKDADRDLTFKVANSIWNTEDARFLPSFGNTIADAYDGGAFPSSADRISGDVNRWISDKTAGMIGDVLDVNSSSAALLVNVLVYRQPWNTAFNPANNTEGPFHNSDGSAAAVEYMNDSGMQMGYISDECRMVRLMMGHAFFDFRVLLPQEGHTIGDVIAYVREKGWFEIDNESRLFDVNLSLPKFGMESNMDIAPVLKSMGLESIFRTDCSGLDKILDSKTFVGQTRQANTISIDEEGIRAASATVVDMGYTDFYKDLTGFDMTLDRPFIFAVSERTTKSILYIGVVNHLDPTR